MERTRRDGTNSADLIAELGRKYVRWQPVGDAPHSTERIIAQAMNLGAYEDIRRLERALGFEPLAEITAAAEPGWFSPRSWEFWRGRLADRTGRIIADAPPRRTFRDAPAP